MALGSVPLEPAPLTFVFSGPIMVLVIANCLILKILELAALQETDSCLLLLVFFEE